MTYTAYVSKDGCIINSEQGYIIRLYPAPRYKWRIIKNKYNTITHYMGDTLWYKDFDCKDRAYTEFCKFLEIDGNKFCETIKIKANANKEI